MQRFFRLDVNAPLFDASLGTSHYAQAWVYMTEVALDMENSIGIPVDKWSELTMVEVGLQLTHGIEIVNPDEQQIFYRVTEDAADLLIAESVSHVDAFDAAMKIAIANIWNWEPMPIRLKAFTVGVLDGRVQRPKQPGGGVTNLFLRWQIYSGCHAARDLFGLPLIRKDYEEPESAADLMANLATEFGHTYSFNTIRDWLNHKNYTKFRERCDAATNYIRDKYLFDLGVTKTLR